jgi:hypothetical protein
MAFILSIILNLAFMLLLGILVWTPYLVVRDFIRYALYKLGFDFFLIEEKKTLGLVNKKGQALNSYEEIEDTYIYQPEIQTEVKEKSAMAQLEIIVEQYERKGYFKTNNNTFEIEQSYKKSKRKYS